MKPYIAILIDSFWEALGNRVLWALLLGWSFVLLGLAPFGYITERSYKLSSIDIDNRTLLVDNLAKGVKGQGSQAVQAVVARLSPAFAARLQQVTTREDSQQQRQFSQGELAQELNKVIAASDLYSEAAFPSAKRRLRLQPLIESAQTATLNEAEVEELNRELLQLAFPLELNRPQGEQLWIGYAGFKIAEPLPVSKRQIKQFFEPILLGFIIKLGLGILAVFVAIVVTSPIIPETFRSGSLHLLLSKPISRIWLYLAKFFGGCVFVLVNITFVLIGLYFIAGLRFDIWNEGLLACIPILMFVFIIFYSVSALAGLIWGNAIVSVVVCMVFWLFCFSIGAMHDAILPQTELLPQISRIRKIEDKVLTVSERGVLSMWNPKFSVWQPAIDSDVRGQARTFGPIFDEKRELIITKSFFQVPFGGLQARSRKLAIIHLKKNSDGTEEAATAQPTSASQAREQALWLSEPGPELPAQLFDIVEIGPNLIAICRGGLFKLDPERLDDAQASNNGLFGLKLPWATNSAFENIAPQDYFVGNHTTASATQAADGLIVFSSGSLDHFAFSAGRLTPVSSTRLDGDGTEAALVQMNDSHCIVVRDGLPIQILDRQLQPLLELDLPDAQKVRQINWIPDSQDLAIITHNGNLLRLNCVSGKVTELSAAYRGNCTCMHWQSSETVWLGVKPNSVCLWNINSGEVLEEYIPAATLLERIFRWGVRPVYLLNPKPAALDTAMSYALTGSESQGLGLITNDLEAAQIEVDIWTPIVTNLIFVTFILGISCFYVSRKEF